MEAQQRIVVSVEYGILRSAHEAPKLQEHTSLRGRPVLPEFVIGIVRCVLWDLLPRVIRIVSRTGDGRALHERIRLRDGNATRAVVARIPFL